MRVVVADHSVLLREGLVRLLTEAVLSNTVEKHVQNIFSKLEIPSTTDDHGHVLAVLTF